MLRPKTNEAVEENELLVRHSYNNNVYQSSSLGVPRTRHRVWRSDIVLTISCLLCFGLSLVVVFEPKTAVWLGQVNQLIALGILLQLMALCTQRTLQYFYLVIECLWNTSSLQNFESIIQANFAAPQTSMMLRFAILLYLALPLALGVAYKNFTGGTTTAAIVPNTGLYGWTGPPGTTGLGTTGIALFYNATVPWWTDPRPSGTYGFNLNVESFNRSALLDGPTEEHVRDLQGMLKFGESMTLNTSLNATVCDMVFDLADTTTNADICPWFPLNLTPDIDLDEVAANPVQALNAYANISKLNPYQTTIDRAHNLLFSMLIMPNSAGWVWNTSLVMTSRWNDTAHETFGSRLQGHYVYRQKYHAVWHLTPSTINLQSARPIPGTVMSNSHLYRYNYPEIGNNYMLMHELYARAFIDFDWRYMGDYMNDPSDQMPQQKYTRSDATLVAAMEWARLTSFSGLTNPHFNRTANLQTGLRIYANPETYQKTSPTLQRSIMLFLVLAINPLVLLTTLIVRVLFLYDAPISKDFGFATLLAGIEKESLSLVKGAAYSGELRRDVRLRFRVSTQDNIDVTYGAPVGNSMRNGTVTMKLEGLKQGHQGDSSNSDRVQRNVLYS